jgi:hypothetical protein
VSRPDESEYDGYVVSSALAQQAKDASRARAIPDRNEAVRYLTAVAAEAAALILLLTANAWGLAVALVLLLPTGLYFRYLAQRANGATSLGDYLVGPRIDLRTWAVSVGSLAPRAIAVLRTPERA